MKMFLSCQLHEVAGRGNQRAPSGDFLPVRKPTMKTLLLSILLAILALQGAVPALGLENVLDGQTQGTRILHASEEGKEAGAVTEVSIATEELSDYLPFHLAINDACCRAGSQGAPAVPVHSIILPTLTPPPRG